MRTYAAAGRLMMTLVVQCIFVPNGTRAADERAHTASQAVGIASYAGNPSATQRCGPNSLYMLMRLDRHSEVEYEDMVREVSETGGAAGRGVSLDQLVRAAAALGFPCAAKKLRRLEELRRCRPPLIVHCSGGHYCVLVDIDAGSVRLIDGSSAAMESLTSDAFAARWTGYILEPTRAANELNIETTLGLALAISGSGLCAYAWIFRVSVRRGPRARTNAPHKRAIRAVSLSLSAVVACQLLGRTNPVIGAEPSAAHSRTGGYWRVPARDGLNCLYLLLRLTGRPVGYGDLVAAGHGGLERGLSLNQLSVTAHQLGAAMLVTWRVPSELTEERLPLIAHLDGSRPGDGEFVLVISRSHETIRIIDGKTIALTEVSVDDFLRNWSGFVLEPVVESFRQKALVSAGGGLCMLAFYVLAVRTACAGRTPRDPTVGRYLANYGEESGDGIAASGLG